MARLLGKEMEKKFLEDWKKSFPQGYIYRVYDQMTGYKMTSQNPCDFISYVEGHLFLAEVKSHSGNVFPFQALVQFDRLNSIKVEGVHPLVVLWFTEHDRVIVFPIDSIAKMKEDGLKSININTYNQYEHIDIPSKKKRVFMDSDYRCVLEYFKNKLDEVK